MEFFKKLICLVLLITTHLSFLDAGHHHKQKSSMSIVEEKSLDELHLWTYDEILRLLDELESGKIEKKYISLDLAKIDRFLVLLAKEGKKDASPRLESDIAELLPSEQVVQQNQLPKDLISASICKVNLNFFSYFFTSLHKSNWKNTKKFVKRQGIFGQTLREKIAER